MTINFSAEKRQWVILKKGKEIDRFRNKPNALKKLKEDPEYELKEIRVEN